MLNCRRWRGAAALAMAREGLSVADDQQSGARLVLTV